MSQTLKGVKYLFNIIRWIRKKNKKMFNIKLFQLKLMNRHQYGDVIESTMISQTREWFPDDSGGYVSK